MALNRREFLTRVAAVPLAAVLGNALAACSTGPKDAPPLDFNKLEGELVPVREILSQKIPLEDWTNRVNLSKEDIVVVFDKKRNLFGLFDKNNGGLIRVGAASYSRTSEFHSTPDGEQFIYELKGAGYRSRDFNSKMDYASFFGDETRGRAIHASANFVFDPMRREWLLRVKSSHGCINVSDDDALAINAAYRATRQKGRRGSVIVF